MMNYREQTENKILLLLSNEIARMRGKEDMAHLIRNSLKQYIDFDDSFILRYNKDTKTCRSYIFHAEKDRLEDAAFNIQVNMEYPVEDDSVTHPQIPVVQDVKSLLQGGNKKVSFIHRTGIKEFVSIKLIEGNEMIGLFILLSTKKKTFTPQALRLLTKISQQISIATANIIANEDIAKREEEKTILLSLSNELASLNSRQDLSRVVNTKIKKLLSIEEFGIAQIDEEGETYSAFVLEFTDQTQQHADFNAMTSAKYSVRDKIFTKVIHSREPVLFDVEDVARQSDMPEYVRLWKEAGFKNYLTVPLRVGGVNIGFVNFHFENKAAIDAKIILIKGVCAQLAIAVSNILAHEKIHRQLAEIEKYRQQLEEEKIYLKEEIETSHNHSEIIGQSPGIKKVFRLVSQVASSDSTVLLLGETGTGKELIARAIHNSSPRKNKLMIKINCAALPANLIESELFGHERGSFTGAFDRRIGKFELADHSTLFLDEIGELSLELQVKLLRALQEKEIERIGGKTTIKTDVRIIAATNRDLETLMDEGKFRSDLYYRLNIFPIQLPPLRERREDIPDLAAHFIFLFSQKAGKKIRTLNNKVMEELKNYHWPGNIRELEHLIERSVLLTDGDAINEIHLPHQKTKSQKENLKIQTIFENEKEYILKVLKHVNGRISGDGGAAHILGIPPSTLSSRIKKLGISRGHHE